MKLVIMAMVLFSAGNALAQTYQPDPNVSVPAAEPDPIGQMSLDQCRSNLRECIADIGEQGEDNSTQLVRLAERMGFASVDDMLTSDCRSRRGTWSNGECLCASPNSWFTEESQECCTENTRAYSRRQESCRESGGNWSCRGGCRCPMGTQLLDGRCQGEAATRDEIDQMRNHIPELESEIARIQGELDQARTEGDAQADQISNLESQLAAAQNALDELRDLLALREEQLRDALGAVPPAPIPGSAEAIAEVARGSEPGPLEPAPIDEGEDEPHFCNANFGGVLLCYILPAVATTGLGVGIWAVTRDIEIHQ